MEKCWKAPKLKTYGSKGQGGSNPTNPRETSLSSASENLTKLKISDII